MDSIVVLERITKLFTTGRVAVKALNGIDLAVEHGDFTAFVGPSGSGKTTLLNIIGCLERPTEGRVIWEGQDTARLSGAALSYLRRRRIGFIFQHFNLIPVLTAYENIEFPLLLTNHSHRQERVWELLEAVGLADRANQRPAELSGGEQQRVAIARALAPEPLLVLADEPTGDLDSATTEEVVALMAQLNRSQGTTFLFSTHDPLVMHHARRVILLVDGRIAAVEEQAQPAEKTS